MERTRGRKEAGARSRQPVRPQRQLQGGLTTPPSGALLHKAQAPSAAGIQRAKVRVLPGGHGRVTQPKGRGAEGQRRCSGGPGQATKDENDLP